MKKLFSSGFFGLTLLCFCLPWVSVSCQQQKIMSVTGIQMLSGIEMNEPGGGFLGRVQKKKRLEPNVLAIVALVAAATALLISLSGGSGAVLPAIIGIATAIALKVNIDQGILKQSQGLLLVDYELGFIGYIFLMAGGAISSVFPNNSSSAINPVITELDDTKKCPVCAENINRHAVICKFCGENVNTVSPCASGNECSPWLTTASSPTARSDTPEVNFDMPASMAFKGAAAKFCSQCGTSVIEGSVFCYECGQRVSFEI